MLDKTQLRQQMNQQRDAMSPGERSRRSDQCFDRMINLPVVCDATLIFCFISHRSEIDTHRLIQHWLAEGKQIAVPLIIGRGIMHAHYLRSFNDLAPGVLGILAPTHPDPIETAADITCCPGLAFTERGDRLGFGGGYYDRYLAAHRSTTAIGLCFDMQVLDVIPANETDLPMHNIVTDQRVITR